MPSSVIRTINPATGKHLATYKLFPEQKALRVAKRAHETFESVWSGLSISERGDYLKKLARGLREKKSEYAKLMTSEMGKTISQAESEIEKCAWAAEFYSENAERWLQEEFAQTDAKMSYVSFQPLGVVLSVMPWNFPFWQALRFAIPALAVGNTTVIRHSNACPGSALAIEELFANTGFPAGVFSTVITDHKVVASLIESDYVAGVSLTGSVEAGRRIGDLAATNLKKFVLELGGSDPYIVLDDADLDSAAEVGATARLQNTGQSCICAKRFIVVESVAKEFTEKFVEKVGKRKVGDPMDHTTDVGPLVNTEQVATVHAQVKDAIRKGAKVRIGGVPMKGPGAFYNPTVLDEVSLNMKVMYEEVFGPVAPVYVVPDEREAIRTANDSEFGLGSSLWTTNLERARRLAGEIQSGMVFINAMTKSDPRMPFGGVKRSGIGRELSKYGLREFVNVKSVNIYGIEVAPQIRSPVAE